MTPAAKKVAIIGAGVGVAQCALVLAQLGAEVTVLTPSMDLGSDATTTGASFDKNDFFYVRPVLLQAISHPRITCYTNTNVHSLGRRQGQLHVKATRFPRYVRPDLCTGCGQCAKTCSVRVTLVQNGQMSSLNAIRGPINTAAPISAYSIEKRGVAPCTAACPLGINVQGFVSLLANGKVNVALRLIHEAAPLAGVLGRVCTHPCEDACKRAEVDDSVFIKALHRYAADNPSEEVQYRFKAPAGSRKKKIAIVGSGPAGLAAAWELARRGYSPVIYESHAVIGGMLATGIPRFRLPREIRERDVKAIERMGVKIRTGVTIGRDVTITDLRERGYHAFFLAIGAHENKRLNIPGEDIELKGVTDCTSFLFELNYGEGVSVGRNMVVIGGGNSAIDSARTAMRKGRRKVTILYRRTAAEMTAIKEDIEEALKEGVSIEYLTSPVEIFHDGSKVTGIRCQRMQLGEVGADGRRKPVSIPGSEFVMDADHVVLAIGQRPDSTRLNVKALKIDSHSATIKVDPFTLETGIDGVFAGGDCVTGPNTVVDAVADGLRAAESIDRYLRGRSLRKGRNLKTLQPVEVNVNERLIIGNKRADMPVIPYSFRMDSFEETNIGLSSEMVSEETARCLNCAICSDCMECERACDLHAVIHDDSAEKVRVGADAVVKFYPMGNSSEDGSSNAEVDSSFGWPLEKKGVYTVYTHEQTGLWNILEQALAVALEVSLNLDLSEERQRHGETRSIVTDRGDSSRPLPVLACDREVRTAIFLCKCGGSVSSVIDFKEVVRDTQRLPGVCTIHEIFQACSELGAWEIAAYATEFGATKLVLAACRCCNADQICFNCNDRRVLCNHYLHNTLPSELCSTIEYVNIREHCAWVHSDQPMNATHKAIELISAAVSRKPTSFFRGHEEQSLQRSFLVLGNGICSLTAAKKLAAEGYSVAVISSPEWKTSISSTNGKYEGIKDKLMIDLQKRGVPIHSWPVSLDFFGSPGRFEGVLDYGSGVTHIAAGAVLVCVDEVGTEILSKSGVLSERSLLGRILKHRTRHREGVKLEYYPFRERSFAEHSGIFITSLEEVTSAEQRIVRGGALAAQILLYFSRDLLRPRTGAVVIDRRLCRGCEECAELCPLIELKKSADDTLVAYVDSTLCLGCGACIACCPTGAIRQHLQGDDEIISMMNGLLKRTETTSEVTWENL
ncbi:MAG: FAD-dependent oxidoreductase [Pseudomonadota bacterium]